MKLIAISAVEFLLLLPLPLLWLLLLLVSWTLLLLLLLFPPWLVGVILEMSEQFMR